MKKIIFKNKVGYGKVEQRFFDSYDDVIKFLKDKEIIDEIEFELGDVYEAVRPPGNPFHYWEAGEKMSLLDWILFSRKNVPIGTKGKSDLQIIWNIVTNKYLWKKV